MVRTVIALDPRDKRWLDQQSEALGISMAELIRRAVRLLRAQGSGTPRTAQDLLEATFGIGSGEDGLAVQDRLRNEW